MKLLIVLFVLASLYSFAEANSQGILLPHHFFAASNYRDESNFRSNL